MGSVVDKLLTGHYNKFVVALIGALGLVVSEGLLPEAATSWVNIVIAFLTPLSVFGVKNYEYYQGKREKGDN